MLERFAHNIDKYCRRENSALARSFRVISPEVGEGYHSELPAKRLSEVAIALPAAVASLPLVGVLALLAKAEDKGSAFFVHRRMGKNGKPLNIVKIRCMRPDAEASEMAILKNPVREPELDPRSTKVGKIMRKFELEELPQLWQVLKGELSLVGIRATNQNAIDYAAQRYPQISRDWEQKYLAEKPGLFSLNAAANSNRKNDLRKLRYDFIYSRKKSLGLDAYIVVRASARILRKLFK